MILFETDIYIFDEYIKQYSNDKYNIYKVNDDSDKKDILSFMNTGSLFIKKDKVVIFKLNKLDIFEKDFVDSLKKNTKVEILIHSNQIDKRKAIYKACEIKTQKIDSKYLNKFVSDYFNKHKRKINKNEITYLLSIIDTSLLYNIKNEMDKLILYTEFQITLDDIYNVVIKSAKNMIWDYLEIIIKDKDIAKSVEVINNLFDNGVHILQLSALLKKHLRILFYFRLDDIDHLKLPPFLLYKYKDQAKFFGEKQLVALLEKLTEYEVLIKNGFTNQKLLMLQFTVALIQCCCKK